MRLEISAHVRRVEASRRLVIVLPDVRFNNEALVVRENGGAMIDLHALWAEETAYTAHTSEKGVDPEFITVRHINDHTEGTKELDRIAQEIYENEFCSYVTR